MSACAAQNGWVIEFVTRPDSRLMIRECRVTIEARIPTVAAFELNRDNIQRRIPMPAARLLIYFDSVYFASVDNSHE